MFTCAWRYADEARGARGGEVGDLRTAVNPSYTATACSPSAQQHHRAKPQRIPQSIRQHARSYIRRGGQHRSENASPSNITTPPSTPLSTLHNPPPPLPPSRYQLSHPHPFPPH